MSKPIKVAVIYGSVRNGRLCDAVAGWVADRVEARADYTLDVIDPLAEGLTDLRGTDGATEKAIAARLSRADAFIVVTPEYNHTCNTGRSTAGRRSRAGGSSTSVLSSRTVSDSKEQARSSRACIICRYSSATPWVNTGLKASVGR